MSRMAPRTIIGYSISSIELLTASWLLAGLGQVAVGHLRVDARVVQGTYHHREGDSPRCRAIVFRGLEVITLVCGEHSDQQPDEHNDAENSATSHAAPPSVYCARNWRAAAVYPADNLSKPS